MRKISFAWLSCLLLPLSAHASQVQVSPTRLSLDPEAPAAVLTLTNAGNDTVRFEVEVSQWDESEDGQMLLEPSSGLVVFPRIVELAPGATRPIRVAARAPSWGLQRTFRVFVTEMPNPAAQSRRTIQVLSRFGVPVFVGPAVPEPRIRVASARFDAQGELEVRLENAGTGFAFVRRIKARGPGGQLEWAGWYLLRDRKRSYRGRLEGQPEKIEVAVELEDGSVIEQTVLVAR